jgi:hypothetical protein
MPDCIRSRFQRRVDNTQQLPLWAQLFGDFIRDEDAAKVEYFSLGYLHTRHSSASSGGNKGSLGALGPPGSSGFCSQKP